MSARSSQATPERLSTSIRVRLIPREKRQLERLADRAGVSMAHAMREGVWLYLTQQITEGVS